MLILSRKQGEKVRIGPDVTLMVVDIRGDKVRLGFEAPAHIDIDREEVWEAKRRKGRVPGRREDGDAG